MRTIQIFLKLFCDSSFCLSYFNVIFKEKITLLSALYYDGDIKNPINNYYAKKENCKGEKNEKNPINSHFVFQI